MAQTPLPEQVRRSCAEVARVARWVRIDPHATTATTGVAGLDPVLHFLEGAPEQVARYVLILDAINFGSGWFPTLRHGSTNEMTERLTARVRQDGRPWSAAELRALVAADVAEILDEDAAHPLMAQYADGLRQLGGFLGDRDALDVIDDAGGSAARLAAALAAGMPYFADHGLYKRAQIAANDLVLAGVADFADVDELTVFADNFLPHVLRLDGVLVLDDELASRIDRGELLEAGGAMERELRACAVHACELLAQRLGIAPRLLDNWLWNRGCEPAYAARPAHLTRTVFY
jgi:Potential Queuosine, Q, salvage protein family